jgi:CRISPR/Cas system-associated exonuclease Cas4 (RecB family)
MATFDECPRKWYCKSVLKIKEPPAGPALLFGTAMHSVLENLLKGNIKLHQVGDISFYSMTGKQAEGNARIGELLTYNAMDTLDRFNLAKENGLFSAEGQILLENFNAIIDLIITDESGRTYVIDWKTTSESYTEHQIKTSEQLTAYAWVFHKRYGKLPDYVCYVTLDKTTLEVRLYRSTRTLEDIKEFEDKVDEVLKEMEFVRRKNPDSCEGKYGLCSFYNICWGKRTAEIEPSRQLPSLTKDSF